MLTVAGERLTFRIRGLTLRSILAQRIGWFDSQENSVGSLCFRLSNDASAIQGATGARIGLLVQVFVSIFFALVLSFVWNWKLALANSAFVPIVLFSSIVEIKISSDQWNAKEKALEKSTRIGTEAISNIRTVVTLGLEEKFYMRYMDSLHEPCNNAKRLSPIRGFILGLASNIVVFASIICLAYGIYLFQNEGLPYKNVFKTCEALIFGMELVGHTLAFTPNYGRAKTAASRIFQLIEGASVESVSSSTNHNNLQLEGRLSSVRDADNILVVDRGRFKEEGTHEELLAMKGIYYRFWMVQTWNKRKDLSHAGSTD